MKHVIVTRFAVPHPGSEDTHRDPRWLARRFELFRSFYVPSVARCGVPAILLCGSAVAEEVANRVRDLDWISVEVQDGWRDGWTDSAGRTITRLDSDDAIHPGWFSALDDAPLQAEILSTREYLRLDFHSGRLHHYRRNEPTSLTAFRRGVNPYATDHRELESSTKVHFIEGAWLLQIVHGDNLSNRPLRPWRLDRRTSQRRLTDFGIAPVRQLSRG